MAAVAWPDWAALAPAIVLGLTALLLLVVDSIYPHTRDNPILAGISTLGAVVAGGLAAWFLASGTGDVTPSRSTGARWSSTR